MAPLGIITILVSAIRVGGPAWLKAVVGRARENMSAAEMELMSSTSKEVCELYNRQTIVRCQGSTPVWEFIYLIPISTRNQDLNKKLDIKVVDLEEACKGDKRLLRKIEGSPLRAEAAPSQGPSSASTSKMAKMLHKVLASSLPARTRDDSIERGIHQETRSEQSPNEAIYVIRKMNSDAPNIILNLQSNTTNNRRELKAYAMIGVFLQLCVLAFFGIITYHPTIRDSFQKDDQRVDDYASPLAISGTLVLVLGIFLCGTIVEKSTDETHYKKNEHYEMGIVWIQQKQTVGDQVFEPFAIFPGELQDVVTVSQRPRPSKRELEPWAVIGMCTSLAGFIIQFIGLRGMNSAATLAQLGAVGIMTVIRAWVRRKLAKPSPQNELTSGFELDTLAWALTLLNHERGPGHQDLEKAGKMSLESQKHLLWSLWTGDEVDHRPFLPIKPPSNPRAQQVFETRWNLSRLAQFKGASADEAVNLATAMEKIMSVLFPLSSEEPERAWAWPLAVVYSDSESTESRCHVNISLTGKEGAWKVLADQLESVLSLCLFTAQKKEGQSMDGQAGFNLNNENDDWLRQKTMNSGLGIRLLGSTDVEKTGQLIQDLRWWAPETFDVLAEIQDDNITEGRANNHDQNSKSPFEAEIRQELDQIIKSDPRLDDVSVDNNRVVGYGAARSLSQSKSTKQRRFRNFSTLPEPERRERRRGTLAIESHDSLEKLFAKDLLFSFFISAAKTLPAALQTKVTTRETANGTSTVLATKEMTSLVTEFSRLGYGAEQEAWLNIIAPLSIAEKLPFPRPLVDLVREKAGSRLRNDDLKSATDMFLELWEQTQLLSSRAKKIRAWGTAFLVEHFRHLQDEIEWTGQESSLVRQMHMVKAQEEVLTKLRASKHQQGFWASLLELYNRQGPLRKLKNIQSLADLLSQDGPPPQDGFPDYFGISELHLKAMDTSKESVKAWEEEVWDADVWASIDERDICDFTPLHYAAARKNGAAIKALARRGADPNLKSLNGFTAVHYLCDSGYQERDAYWNVSWKLDARGFDGATPMHIAARRGNLEFFKSLTRREPNFDLRDYHGRLPVHWAVMHGREEVVQHLKKTIDEQDKDGWTSLHLAALHETSESTMIRTVVQLSKDREKLDNHGNTPLVLACKSLKPNAIRELVQAGADANSTTPDGKGWDKTVVQALVDHGAKVDAEIKGWEGATILQFAIERGRDATVEILLGALDGLDRKARSKAINRKNDHGSTALHLAASCKRLENMKKLLSKGAKPNRKDKTGGTPLHCVLDGSDENNVSLEMVKTLVENGADPGAQDYDDKTPLDYAEEGGFADAAEYLRGVQEARELDST